MIDEFGLAETSDGHGEGVVVTVADGADWRFVPGGDQRARVRERNVLTAPVAVMGKGVAGSLDQSSTSSRTFLAEAERCFAAQ